MSSSVNESTHWCYRCRQPVRPPTLDLICPSCDNDFLQELSEALGNMQSHSRDRLAQSFYTGMPMLGLSEIYKQRSPIFLNPHPAIEAMPSITITRRHVKSGLQCPVCQEDFERDTEAKQMPCNHLYHFDCIFPWLVQHNSCPVCRLQLRPESNGSKIMRALISFFWPFGGSSDQNTQYNLDSDD